MRKKLVTLVLVVLCAGCQTTIKKTDKGWEYSNTGFNKKIGEVTLHQSEANRFIFKVSDLQSNNQQMVDVMMALFATLGPILNKAAPLVLAAPMTNAVQSVPQVPPVP